MECNFIAHFAKELIDHKHEEEHLEEVTIKCPKCKIKFPMEVIYLSRQYLGLTWAADDNFGKLPL